MSIFYIQSGGCDVPVNIPKNLSQDRLEKHEAWMQWIKRLNNSLAQQSNRDHPFHAKPYKLYGINVNFADDWGSRLGFVKMVADIRNSDDKSDKSAVMPGSIILRGPSVAMLVMLIPDDAQSEEDRHVLLTVQARAPAGSLALIELPAGMVDGNTISAKAGSTEIKEELHLDVKEDELYNLTKLACELVPRDSAENLPKEMYPSAGGCDESITIYACERRVSRADLESYNGKLTGEREKGENITLKVVKMKDLWKYGARDAKALSAVALWNGLRDAGKIPTSLLDPILAARASKKGQGVSQQPPKPASTSSK